MSVDKATVAKIASLARISMDDAARERMVPELNGILNWVEQLGEVDVTGIEPMAFSLQRSCSSTELARPKKKFIGNF